MYYTNCFVAACIAESHQYNDGSSCSNGSYGWRWIAWDAIEQTDCFVQFEAASKNVGEWAATTVLASGNGMLPDNIRQDWKLPGEFELLGLHSRSLPIGEECHDQQQAWSESYCHSVLLLLVASFGSCSGCFQFSTLSCTALCCSGPSSYPASSSLCASYAWLPVGCQTYWTNKVVLLCVIFHSCEWSLNCTGEIYCSSVLLPVCWKLLNICRSFWVPTWWISCNGYATVNGVSTSSLDADWVYLGVFCAVTSNSCKNATMLCAERTRCGR